MIKKIVLIIVYFLICSCNSCGSNSPTSHTPILGCTDIVANNFNVNAIIDDGSCIYTGTGDHPMNSLWFIANVDGTWGVGYTSNIEIGGFQFDIDGTTILSAYSGASGENGFSVNIGSSTVIGFSFGGSTIPAGENILTILQLEGIPTGISSITISNSIGTAVPFIFDDSFFSMVLEATGESQLLILSSSISSLQNGDEIGIYDSTGILNYNDCTNQIGEILVGTGKWQGSQLEIINIGSVNMCDFGGVQLSGYISSNSIVVKVWDTSQRELRIATPQYSVGNGLFSDPLIVISELNF